MSKDNVFGVVLSNGIEIPFSDRAGSTTGLRGSSYNPVGNGARWGLKYVAGNNVRTDDNTGMDEIDSRGTLGFFDDPRKAAYMTAYFKAHPNDIINKFKQIKFDKAGNVNKGFRTEIYKGALAPEFPADLFTKLPFEEEEIKSLAAAKKAALISNGSWSKTTAAAPKAKLNVAWKDFRTSLGIEHGSQILSVLPGGSTPANMAFLSKLAQMSADDAVAALAEKGINLEDPTVLAKVKSAPIVNESTVYLDRIRQLIKY